MIDVSRDPRWGRIAEGPGEDTWLASRYAVAKVRGIQGDGIDKPENMAATIYKALGLPRKIAWKDQLDRPHFVYQADPIKGLT